MSKRIFAKHVSRLDNNGKPVTRYFSEASWRGIPSATIDGEIYPKGGWTQVNPKALEDPPEVKEIKKANKAPGGSENMEPTQELKAQPKAQPKAEEQAQKVRSGIKSSVNKR